MHLWLYSSVNVSIARISSFSDSRCTIGEGLVLIQLLPSVNFCWVVQSSEQLVLITRDHNKRTLFFRVENHTT
jgi:hypothetical protein